MLSRICLIFLSLSVLSCNEQKIDAFKCLFMKRDPISESYWFCYNPKTKEEVEIAIQDTGKCIRSNAKCDWVGSDINEFESAQKQFIEQHQCPRAE